MSPSLSLIGAPREELDRSPAASTVGRLATESGLLLAHFEHRAHLALPEEWEPASRGDLGEAQSGWTAGRLTEPKYRSFQLDRRIGSFHPGHRAKWTSHELCHGLVGFAWAPGKSALWHATAARLSELLPVVLYYFFDEAGLRRCPLHQGGGPLYRSFCPACEAAARTGPQDDPDASRWIAGGRAFLDRELAAVARTRRKGAVVPHHHATLDLSSDGLAYAAGHLPRLRSAAFNQYIDRFFGENEGYHSDLDELVARIEAIADALCGGDAPPPMAGGRWRWIAQDLAWRVMLVVEQSDGEVVEALDDAVLEPLSQAGAPGVSAADSEAAVIQAIAAYREIHADWVVPEPGEIFGVGYALPGGLGRCEAQVYAGIQSALPGTCALLQDEAEELASDFTWSDSAIRRPIGQRFSIWLDQQLPDSPPADQARFEAAMVHAPVGDAAEQTLGRADGTGRLKRAAGVAVITVSHAVSTDIDVLMTVGALPLEQPMDLAIRRNPDGEVAVFQLDGPASEALLRLEDGPQDAPDLGLDEGALDELLELGLILPEAWTI